MEDQGHEGASRRSGRAQQLAARLAAAAARHPRPRSTAEDDRDRSGVVTVADLAGEPLERCYPAGHTPPCAEPSDSDAARTRAPYPF